MSILEGLKSFAEDAKERVGEVVKPEDSAFDDTIDKANKWVEKAQGLEDWKGISNAIEFGNEEILEDYRDLSEAMALKLIDEHPDVVAKYADSFEKPAHRAMVLRYIENGNVSYVGPVLEKFTGLDQRALLDIIDAVAKIDNNTDTIRGILDMSPDGIFLDADPQILFEKVADKGLPTPILDEIDEHKFSNLNWGSILQKLFEATSKQKDNFKIDQIRNIEHRTLAFIIYKAKNSETKLTVLDLVASGNLPNGDLQALCTLACERGSFETIFEARKDDPNFQYVDWDKIKEVNQKVRYRPG